ncbi:transcriptional regulator [Lactococcus garvieae]|uniref:transcriptional regulator n=1 Tax=Lactococcus garvieae TaxID=1363 RepID=UPI0022E13174|nr:transcriptional regulator [Lactococcus garvieae]
MTLQMVADQAGLRRESIYRYHFDNMEDIIEKIHFLIDKDIDDETAKFMRGTNTNIVKFVSHTLLPLLYARKEWIKILCETNVDPNWLNFLQEKYSPVVEAYLNKIGKKEIFSNAYLANILLKEFLSILSTWLTDDIPESVSLFQKKFLYLLSLSPADIANVKMPKKSSHPKKA